MSMSDFLGVSRKKKHPSRWISNIFDALVKIAVVFAEHGPGRMPAEQNRICESSYLRYRMDYNSSWLSHRSVIFGFRIFTYPMLAPKVPKSIDLRDFFWDLDLAQA